MRTSKVLLYVIMFFIFVGCSPSSKYCDLVLDSHNFLTDVTNRNIFDKCFVAYTLSSYRDKDDHCIYVSLDGKFMIDDNPHSVKVLYWFANKNDFTITDFIIDGESEPEVMFMYYISQLYDNQ